MKALLTILAALCVCCDGDKRNSCDDYCDLKSSAAQQDAINQLCVVAKGEIEQYDAKCLNDCNEVFTYIVDSKEQGDLEKCLDCVIDTVTKPSSTDISRAKNECFVECNNLGSYQFFYSFFISDPKWNC
jgi:hypothetical protein